LWNPGEGWVDLPALVAHLVRQLLHRGGQVVTDAGRATVKVAAGRVRAVRTTRGDRFPADLALLATGADVPRAAAELGVRLPDATPLALLVRTAPVEVGLRVVLNTPRASLRPAPDGGLSVDADWTAGSIASTADGYGVPDELLAEASGLLAGHPQLSAASLGIGPKPIPADGDPVLGPLEVDGLFVAFTHSGATLALVAGELLADQMLTGEQPALLAPFGASRFG
jgi:glycine/D-amino acid oxidase-like deaminating enzyme